MNMPLLWGLGLAFLLSVVNSLWHGLASLSWHLGTLLSVLGIWLLIRHDVMRIKTWVPYLIAIYPMVILVVAVIASQWGGSVAWAGGFRVDLIFGNPNLLAASLVTAMLGSLVLRQRILGVTVLLAQVSGVLALLATASRTGILALIIGYLIYAAINRPSRNFVHSGLTWRRYVGLALIICLSLLLGGVAILAAQSDPRNQLALSGNFGHNAWRVASGAQLEVAERAVTNSTGRRGATRIMGISSESGLVIHQSIGRSQPGVPYVGSIYMRSDQPQTLILGTNLGGESTCNVHSDWIRCATPPTKGNGQTSAQLRIGTDGANAPFDLYLWGAQLELANTPTVFEERTIWHWRLNRLVSTLDPRDWVTESPTSGRFRAGLIALDMFLESPWFGVGAGQTQEVCRSRNAEGNACYGHAHNIILHLLAEGGVIGLLIWLLPLAGGLLTLRASSRVHISPLLGGVLILNTFDVSFYNAGVYYTLYLCLALVATAAFSQQIESNHYR